MRSVIRFVESTDDASLRPQILLGGALALCFWARTEAGILALGVGAWVVVEDESAERCYRLVGPDEADAAAGAISVEAPLGRALLGKREGDVVRVERPAGKLELTVVEVRWTSPDR